MLNYIGRPGDAREINQSDFVKIGANFSRVDLAPFETHCEVCEAMSQQPQQASWVIKTLGSWKSLTWFNYRIKKLQDDLGRTQSRQEADVFCLSGQEVTG